MSPMPAGLLEEEEPPEDDPDGVVGALGDGEVVGLLEDEPEHGSDEQYVPQWYLKQLVVPAHAMTLPDVVKQP